MPFDLRARLGLDGKPFQVGLRKSVAQSKTAGKKMANNFSAGFRGQFAAAFGVAAITAGLKNAIDEAGKIRDKSTSVGIDTESFQELDFAAKQTDTSVEKILTSIARLARSRGLALEGNERAIRSFQAFGLTLEDIKNKQPDELFRAIGASIKESGVNGDVLNNSMELMGRSAAEILPAMVAGLEELSQAARDANVIIKDETVQSLAAAGDQLTTIGAQMKPIFADAAQGLADLALFINDTMQRIGTFIGNFVVTKSFTKATAALDEFIAEKEAKEAEQREALKKKDPEKRRKLKEEAAEAARILAAREKLKALQEAAAFKELDAAGKLNALLEKRSKLVKDIAEGTDEEAKLNAQIELQRLDDKVKDLKGNLNKAKDQASSEKPENLGSLSTANRSDSLRSIGNFLGSDPNRGVIRELQAIKADMKTVANNTLRRAHNNNTFPA